MNNFKIKDKVALAIECKTRDKLIRYGLVTDSCDDICFVKWLPFEWETTKKFNKSIKYLADELITEVDAKAKQQSLEDEYAITSKAILSDIDRAVTALNDAIKTANEFNVKVASIYEAGQHLFPALDDCGWSSSSLNC